MACVAIRIAENAEPHDLLSVSAGTVSGNPDRSPTCRATL